MIRSVRYGVTFVLLAVAFASVAALLASMSWLAAVCFAYTSFSFLLISFAYFGLGPRIFAKGVDGRRHPGSRLLFGPYDLLATVSLNLAAGTRGEPAYGLIVPNLYFGRYLTSSEAESGVALGWVGCLDLAVEFTESPALRALPSYRSLPLLDATAPTPVELAEAVAWLHTRTREGPVYVHCALGHGRTGTIVAAYLLATRTVATVAEALARLRAVRSQVRLNPAQVACLRRYLASGLPSHNNS